jgi:threonine synthase
MMGKIMYKSVGGSGGSPLADFGEVLFRGQAPDGGLYVPTEIPGFSQAEIRAMRHKPYQEVASSVMYKFLRDDDLPEEKLREIVHDAYDFPVPIERVHGNRYIIRLDQGPTASFKDFAARLMARVMHYYIKEKPDTPCRLFEKLDKGLNILVATSGDTGAAIAAAYHGLPGIKVIVTYPIDEVGHVQARMIDKWGDNVTAIACHASFDQLQKNNIRAFSDPDLKGKNNTSANSINWCRQWPQISYHWFAYTSLADSGETILDSVSSGNFGNVTADFYAWRMGKPNRRIIVATNENDEFPVFMETGVYRPIKSKNCLSNAMNVGNPSNMRRLFHLYGGEIGSDGVVRRMPDLEKMRRDAVSFYITDDLTRATAEEAWRNHGIVLEPHGAVSYAALTRYEMLTGDDGLRVSTETAHPAKFPGFLRDLGIEFDVPETLKGLEEARSNSLEMSGEYEEFKEFLLAA